MIPQEQKELLELAAYAVGFWTEKSYVVTDWRGTYVVTPADPTIPRSEPQYFDSLTNKADAFDLMVKLRMDVEGKGVAILVNWAIPLDKCYGDTVRLNITVPVHELGREAATLLALTRAAAAIGKQMKGHGE